MLPGGFVRNRPVCVADNRYHDVPDTNVRCAVVERLWGRPGSRSFDFRRSWGGAFHCS